MYRQFLIGGVAAAIFAAGSLSAQAQQIKWKLGSALPPGHITNEAMIDYTKRIKQRSGGEIDIELVPLDAVGFKEADLLRVLKQGVMDASFFAQFYAFRDDPLLANYAPSGAFTTPEDNLKVIDIQHQYATKVLKERWNAVVVTPIFNRSGRDLILVSRTPMASLADLKGKKMRHFEKTELTAFQNLGVAAQIVAQADLYIALRTGVVNSAIHGIPNVKNQSLWEVTCCFSNMLPFTGQAVLNAIVVPQKNWDRLSEKQRTVLQDVGKELWAELLQEWRDGEKTQRETFDLFKKNGMREMPAFSQDDRKTIQAAVLKAWKEECERLGPEALDLFNRVSKALGSTS